MRIIKFIDKLLNFIVILFFITVIAFVCYVFYDIQEVYNETKLSDDILKYKPDQYVEEAVEKFNLEDLQNEINEDICGWIRIDDTNIDYPILFPHTSVEYLNKDYKKNYTPGGSIFIDFQNDRFFKDSYTAIYGHNMNEKMMFSDIKLFKDKDYFEKHKGGKLYTGEGVYNLKIYTFNILDSNKDIAYKVGQYKNGSNAKIIANFEKSAIFKNDIEISPEDQLIILTTCNGINTPERAVLFCKIEKIDVNGNINDETNSNLEKDAKKKEKEKFEKEKKAESEKNLKELTRDNYKKNEYTGFNSEFEFYWNRLMHDPVKLALYILILVTIFIYIIIIIKKIKRKKNSKGSTYTKVELLNRHRIEILRKAKRIIFKENSNVAQKIQRYDKTKDFLDLIQPRRKRNTTGRKGRHSS